MDFDFLVKAANRDNSASTDFEKDGLRYCGVCGQAKQARIPFGGKMAIVSVMCECENSRWEAEKRQQEKEQRISRVKRMRAESPVHDRYFDRYRLESDDRKNPNVSDTVSRYITRWGEMEQQNQGILLYGAVGIGKSFYAAGLANALADEGIFSGCTSVTSLLNLMQGSRDRAAILDALGDFSFLLLDDLGAERDSSYANEQIFNIIDERYKAGKPTAFTTNLPLKDLEHPATMQMQRIFDRVLEMCPIRIGLSGESRRAQSAKERTQAAREILLQ